MNAATLSDGQTSWPLAARAASQAAWQQRLHAQGVVAADCVALTLRCDVVSASTLLALLDGGQSMLLARTDDTLPAFCRYRIVDGHIERHAGFAAGDASPWIYLATSGSTGVPKRVAYTHAALSANACNACERFGLSAADRVIVPVPLAHMYGLGAAFLPAVAAGASVRFVPDANLISYLQAEAEFEPTVAFLTPSFCHLLGQGRKQSRPYRLTVLAGDRADSALLARHEARHGCTICLYGSTELGAIAAGAPAETTAQRHQRVGTPLAGVQLQPPADTAAPFPLRFRHAHGCAGYADDSGRPVAPPTLRDGDWTLTQDLGDVDADGRLRVVGRVDDSVKRDGRLVAFADVEQALQRLVGVERAVVIAGGDTPRGRELVACWVGSRPAASPSELRREARALLPSHALPDRFVRLRALPLTATGKPDRAALAAAHRDPRTNAEPR